MAAGTSPVQAQFTMDPSGFKRGAEEIINATKRIEAEELRVARATEDFELASSRRRVKGAELAAQGKTAAAARVEQAELDAQRRVARVIEDTERRKAQAVESYNLKAQRAVESAEAKKLREIEQAIAKAVRANEVAESKKLRDEEAADARRSRRIDAAVQKEIQAHERAVLKRNKLEADAMQRQQEDKQTSRGVGGFLDSMAGQLTVANGIQAVMSGVIGMAHEFNEIIDRTNERQKEFAEQLFRQKEIMRGLATMTGQAGATAQFTADFMKFRSETGLSDQAATGFLTEFISTGSGAMGRLFDEKQFEEMKHAGGRLVASQGGREEDASAFARLLGLLARSRKYNSGDEMNAEALDVIGVLQTGVGSDPQLVRQSAKSYGTLLDEFGTGLVKDPRELAAFISAAAAKNPNRAHEQVQMARRVVSGFGERWDPLLTDAGVEEGQSFTQRMEGVFGVMKDAQGRGEDVTQALKGYGVNDDDALAMTAFFNQRAFLRQLQGPGGAAGRHRTGKQAKDEINARFQADAGLQQNQAVAGLEAAQSRRGEETAPFYTLLKQAETRLTDRGELDTTASGIGDYLRGLSYGGGMPWSSQGASELGRNYRIRREAQSILRERGRNVGPSDKPLPGLFMNAVQERELLSEDFAKQSAAAYTETGGIIGKPVSKEQGDAMLIEQKKTNALLSSLINSGGVTAQGLGPPLAPAGGRRR